MRPIPSHMLASVLLLSGVYACSSGCSEKSASDAGHDASNADGGSGSDGGGGSGSDGGGSPGSDSGGSPGSDAGGQQPTGDGGAQGDAQVPEACNATVAPTLPPMAVQTVVADAVGLQRLTYAAQAPGSNAWYLVEQAGRVQVYENGALAATPLLDVRSEITLGDLGDERGLLGLAFPPDYASSRLFYVMLTITSDNHDEVREYQQGASGATPKRTLLTLPISAANHNGGALAFGPDGYLYVGTGDGGGGCNNDKPDQPQDKKSLFGKILRLDLKAAEPYGAPGNPFAENKTVLHVGLRNPFRFSIDVVSNTLYIGDVGQNSYEEVDAVKLDAPGKNFGWAGFEGITETCTGRALAAGAPHEKPIFVADRRKTGCQGGLVCDWVSVIGGAVYRGSALPGLRGTYLFGDYTGSRMAALVYCDGATSPATLLAKVCDPNHPTEACLARSDLKTLTAIVTGNDGELYFVAERKRLLKLVAP